MHKKYQFTTYYTLLPIVVLPLLVIAEYLSISNVSARYQDILITAALLIVMYLSLKFDYCLITDQEFTRRSYFLSKKSLKIREVVSITFPPTWVITPEARTLAVWDAMGRKITMTDMGYSRAKLADVVRTLMQLNSRIRSDKDVEELLKTNP